MKRIGVLLIILLIVLTASMGLAEGNHILLNLEHRVFMAEIGFWPWDRPGDPGLFIGISRRLLGRGYNAFADLTWCEGKSVTLDCLIYPRGVQIGIYNIWPDKSIWTSSGGKICRIDYALKVEINLFGRRAYLWQCF